MRPFERVSITLVAFALFAATFGGVPSPARAVPPGKVKVLVAVTPFRVHSAVPLQYLEESLASLLTARLEASGRVKVVEAVVVREALVGYAAGELTETAIRRLAGELGADYVVAGSLTELAGHYSLDVRVTPVESDVPSRTLVFTADGDEELLDRVNELSNKILEIVAGSAPRSVVAEVRIEGTYELDPEVRADLAIQPGGSYDSSSVRGDLEILRGLPGVATVTIDTERGPEGVIVIYRIISSESILGAPTLESTDRVAEIRVRGNRRIEANAIRARVTTQPGDPYNPTRLGEDVREVYSLGFFRDVRVVSDDSIDGRILTFEVVENPVVRQVSISGNESVDGDRIRDALTLTTGSTLDYPLLYENRERIIALYRAEGFYLAEVAHEIESLPGDAVGIQFDVEEGEKLRLKEIVFTGNEHFTESELRAGFQTRVWRFWSPITSFLDKSGTYAEPVFLRDLERVEKKYTDSGFIRIEVDEPKVETHEDGMRVVVRIHEGKRYRVGEVDVAGDETVDLETLHETLGLQEGEHFSRSFLTQDVERLTQHYTSRGFYFANVVPQTNISESDLTVDVTFAVEKGPLYFVREIGVSGNTTTIDTVVRRELQIVEGELYSARAIQMSQGRVRGLGYFEEVNFEPVQTDSPEQLDLDIRVVERPTGSLSFGAGFSTQDSFIVSGSVSQTNLFGRGYAVSLSADVGGNNDRFFLSFSNPYLFGSTFSFHTTLFNTDVEFIDFEQEQTGIEFTLGHALDELNRERASIRYSWASRDVRQASGVNAASLIFREVLGGEESTSLLGLAWRKDTRDDRVAPTSGSLMGASLEYAGLGGFSEFVRFEARGTWFHRLPEWWPVWWPLRDESVVVLGARLGWTESFNDISDYDLPGALDPGSPSEFRPLSGIDTDMTLPLTERYFLGGIGSYQLRGFRARSVGPRRAVLKRSGLFGTGAFFSPVGTTVATRASDGLLTAICADSDATFINNQGDGDGKCNSLYDQDIDDFDDLDETDVVGGSKFISLSAEYRFPISESLGLVGIFFLDVGNAFAEDQSLIDIGEWRYGTGFGALWFSPFGPLQGFVGFPLDKLEVEDGVVFEFSVGGATF